MEEQSRNLSGKVIGSIPILSTIQGLFIDDLLFFNTLINKKYKINNREKFFDILKENTTERDVENTSQHIYYL